MPLPPRKFAAWLNNEVTDYEVTDFEVYDDSDFFIIRVFENNGTPHSFFVKSNHK